jgi:outer membrane receptor protein involved in Fe transport
MRKKSNLKNFMFWPATFLLIVGFAVTPMPESVGAQEDDDEFVLEDIVVTATRRAELISDVPLSITAFGKGEIEAKGLKQIDDLAPFTPGLSVNRAVQGHNNISIRGISSGMAGASTTGIYIDDTPIQVRNLGYGSGSAFPALFDLERVEVLRGPQGTLFGAGSEGGTVRFIQTAPNMDESSAYVRAEYSVMEHGDPSYEVGAAYGAPIIEGKLGFRASVFYREDGGWVDGIKGTPVVLDPTGDAGPDSLTFTNKTVTREDTNSQTVTGFRAALKFALTDSLEITPSITYQKIEINDSYGGFWPAASNGKGDYARPVYDAGDPATNPLLTKLNFPNRDESEDEFILPALTINWDFGPVALISNTSYFDRDQYFHFDFTAWYAWFYGMFDDDGFSPPEGYKSVNTYVNTQKNFVEEIRLQSTDDSARLKWVAGLFYSDLDQTSNQDIYLNFLGNAPAIAPFYYPSFLAAVNDGPPFGPGSSAFENWFGVPNPPDSSIWAIDFSSTDMQLAGFAQIEYDITEDLTLTVGLRVSRTELDFYSQYRNPENNQNAPQGLLNPDYDPSLGPVYYSVAVENKETTTTPKIGLSYDINDDIMLYLNVAKGFRPAGATQRLPPTLCAPGFERLGYVDENENACQPLTYDSDSVWSYELGTKSSLFHDRLFIDASAYLIDWKDIQSGVFVLECAELFTTNLGEARSQGFDLGFQLYPINNLQITGTVGYNRTEFTQDSLSPGGVLITAEGSSVDGAPPPWVYSLSAHYNFTLMDRQFYARVDATHNSERRRSGQTDPTDPDYNPDLSPAPAYSVVDARIGVLLDRLDISLFAKNLFNRQPFFGTNLDTMTGYQRFIWSGNTLQPRNFGIFASYRY